MPQTLVLIHAFPLSGAMWRPQAERLARSVRLIAPDLPGFGRSARVDPPSVARMAQEVAAELDRLGVREPVVMGGLSMGGYVAFEFLRQFPQRLKGLGLFSTRASADAPAVREGRLKTAEKVRREGLAPFARAVLPKLLGRTTLAARPEAAEEVTRMILSNDPGGVADALLAMAGRRDSSDLLGLIRCPVLIVAGDEDSFLPVSEARGMQERIAGAQMEVIPQAGHLASMEQPAAFQAILEQFLRAL